MRLAVMALAGALACAASGTLARGASSSPSYWAPPQTHSKAVPEVPRDAHGKIARSPQALQQFKKSNPCPATGKTYRPCPGYVVDHVMPLKRGGADAPSNMQWQTREEARRKDAWE